MLKHAVITNTAASHHDLPPFAGLIAADCSLYYVFQCCSAIASRYAASGKHRYYYKAHIEKLFFSV
jgi:hypothetical protein